MQKSNRNLRATKEMKVWRDWMRKIVRSIKADPYLKDVSQNLSVRIVSWHPVSHEVLVCVRDTSESETSYNSQYCRWVFVDTWDGEDKWNRYKIWKEINEVVLAMRSREFNLSL